MKHYEFYRSLHARGLKLTTLAAALQTSTPHLSQVFCGHRGGQTRRKLTKYLTRRETDLLGWKEQGTVTEPAESETGEEVPCGTSSQVLAHGQETDFSH